jgi:tetratricopeptide (TPR) repeat protein
LILKSLRSYYSEQSISSILKQEIKNVEILYNKALYKECEKFVVRAKEVARDHEKFYYWFELLSWEKKLLEEAYESGEFSRNLDELIEEEEMVIAKLRNLAEYQVVYSKINLIFRSGGFTRNENERKVVEGIADYHLIKGKNTAISTRASSMCYYIKGLCAATNRNFDDSYTFFNKTREILDKNLNIKSDSGQRYVMTLSHLLRCYIDGKDFVKAQALIDDLRGLEGTKGFNSTDITVRIFTITYNLELALFHAMGEFQKSVELIPKIEALEEQFGDKVSKEQEILLTYNKAHSYFGVGDYKKALYYINLVLNDNEQNLRQDIYSFARLFNLVLHFELENYDFLEYIIKSTNRYFSKQERDFEVETVCIKHIRKLSKILSQNERIAVFVAMKEELDMLLQDHNEKVVLEYFNITAWVESKINKISMSEAVKKNLK